MPDTNDDLRDIAARILAAQDGHVPLAAMSTLGARLSMQDAYRVSWRVHEARLAQGWKPVGRKIGFTNKDLWTLFGVDQPVWSFVYDRTCGDVATEIRCALGDLVQPRVEPEIVLCLREVPPVDATPARILACVEWMAHGIEMVQCHYPDWKFDSADAVCDSSFHGRLYVGPRRSPRSVPGDVEALLREHALRLYKGDALVEVGHGRNVLGSPLLALSSLLQALHRHGTPYPVLPGEIVTTGTLTKAWPVAPGERWRTEFGQQEFGGLTIDFVA
jgi:2-keto-4-pentenoate hydratase